MGKRLKKQPKSKEKTPMAFRPRKLDKKGHIKRKKGDLRLSHSRNVGFDVRQKKGGKWVRASGERKCKIHTVCDCVKRTDTQAMSRIYNR